MSGLQLEARPRGERHPVSGPGPVDDGYGDTHRVTSGPANLTVIPELEVAAIDASPPGPIHAPLDALTVTFTDLPDATPPTAADLTLTRDGGPNLIDSGVRWPSWPGPRPPTGSAACPR